MPSTSPASRPDERNHPRVPPDVYQFIALVANRVRDIMILRHGDGRHIGWGVANRLVLAVFEGMPTQPEDERRLKATREVLLQLRAEPVRLDPASG